LYFENWPIAVKNILQKDYLKGATAYKNWTGAAAPNDRGGHKQFYSVYLTHPLPFYEATEKD
jgi:hypothetical protein